MSKFGKMNPIEYFWSKINKKSDSECWEWLGHKDHHNYGIIAIDHKRYRAHRLSWMLVNGDIPDNKLVMHLCDNPSCVNPNHLKLGTQDDNMKDCKSKGRIVKSIGENHGSAKLTEEQVIEIIKLLNSNKIKQSKIAKIYNVSEVAISRIKLGKVWKHLHNKY